MPKYIIVSGQDDISLENKLSDRREAFYKIVPRVWAVESSASTQKLSEVLFSQQAGDPQPHAIFRIDAYWGYNDRELWELLSRKEV